MDGWMKKWNNGMIKAKHAIYDIRTEYMPAEELEQMRFTNPIELPALQEIDEMDKKRTAALDSLDISGNSVKCQKCGMVVPMLRQYKMSKNNSVNARRSKLNMQKSWVEKHFANHDSKGNGNGNDMLQKINEELAQLEEQEAKAEKLRNIPLYSCTATDFLFCCSACFDKASRNYSRKQNKLNRLKGLHDLSR